MAASVAPVMTCKEAGGLGGAGNKAFDKNENIKRFSGTDKGGTSKEYRIAKLKRDYPEVAERSVNTAKKVEQNAMGNGRYYKMKI